MRLIARIFVGYVVGGTILTMAAVAVSMAWDRRPAAQISSTQPSPQEKRLAELRAERREQDHRVAKCMGPGAGNLRPRDYSAMLDACERANVIDDPQVEADVEKRIADARSQIVDEQERERAAEASQQ